MPRFAAPIALLLAGCAARVTPPPVIALPAPPLTRASLPEGATANMAVPERLADGSFPTPNRGLTQAAALWHLRAGLNVAALACRGPEEAALVAGYNGWLRAQGPALAAAEAGLAAEYRAGAPSGEAAAAWRARYDAAMTRLYNYWSQTPARAGLCAASAGVLAEVPAVPPGGLAAAAPAWLERMDRPVTDFYAAYDAWRRGAPGGTAAVPAPVRTEAVPAGAAVLTPVVPPAPAPRPAPPELTVDPSVFRHDDFTSAVSPPR